MATKIRLQRHGKKGKPFYHIVIADSRAKRDGRYIEKIGTYNPNVNPAIINLEFERAVEWYGKGAQPTDTVRAILSYKGVLYKSHLSKGVAKGALTEAEADKKFDAWMKEKEGKVTAKSDKLAADQEAAKKAALAAEKEVNEKRAADIAAKNAPEEMVEEAQAEAAAEGEEAPAAEASTEAAPAEEAPTAEEAPAEETAKEEAAPEAEAKAEEPAKEEAPAEETKEEGEDKAEA